MQRQNVDRTFCRRDDVVRKHVMGLCLPLLFPPETSSMDDIAHISSPF